MGAGELNQRQPIGRLLTPTNTQAAAPGQPAERAFNDPPASGIGQLTRNGTALNHRLIAPAAMFDVRDVLLLGDDLVNSLEELLTREEAVEYVILEASGIADSEGIVMTFLNPRYEGLLRIDSITCIIDAVGIFADGDNERLNLLKLRQIGFADMVILNKTDLVGPDHIQVIREWIGHHIQRVRIVEATQCDISLDILLGVSRFNGVNVAMQPGYSDGEPNHGHDGNERMFETWSFMNPISQCRLKRYARWCRGSCRNQFTGVRELSLLPTPLTNVLPSRLWGVGPKFLRWTIGESVRPEHK